MDYQRSCNYGSRMGYTQRCGMRQNSDTRYGSCASDDLNVKQCERTNEGALAMAYFQKQKWQELHPICHAINRGTIFKELDKPFNGKCRGGCL